MTDMLIPPEVNVVPRNDYVPEGPIDFETWIFLSQDLDTDLISSGQLPFRTVPGFWIEVEWLFDDERPNALDVALRLLNKAAGKQT